jgi:molybdenum cofactor cytidylyltransferase
MKFGARTPEEAAGGIVVHSIRQGSLVLKKGAKIGPPEVKALREAGIASITVAHLEPGDVSEDEAAAGIAATIAGAGVHVDKAFTGRANLFAEKSGVLVIDSAAVDRLNGVGPDITLATLEAFAPVIPGQMIATVKIIPFAVSTAARDRAVAVAEENVKEKLISIAPYKIRKVGVISTVLPGLADKVIEKTLKVTQARLAPAEARIIIERRVPHESTKLAAALEEVLAAGAELVLIFGASAIADRRDVIPSAIEAVGGAVEHFGMPVDPGNLMLIGGVGARPVLGAPGCARSPKENGFDWILSRLLAGLPVTRRDVTGMGVGGLLMEIVTRPQPRAAEERITRRVAGVVLAAGRSTRMGGANKMTETIGGKALVRIAVENVLASQARPVVVVTGHQSEAVLAQLKGLDVVAVHNPDFAEGISTSLRTGLKAVPNDCDGALICLADMPQVSSALMNRLIETFDPDKGALVVVPVIEGQRGNPVLWSRRFFPDLTKIEGDIGGRPLFAQYPEAIVEVPADSGALLDIDTPSALAAIEPR